MFTNKRQLNKIFIVVCRIKNYVSRISTVANLHIDDCTCAYFCRAYCKKQFV